jgi:hypothetical protein
MNPPTMEELRERNYKSPLSVLSYHKNKHQRATKLLINLFAESGGGWFIIGQHCQRLKDNLDEINERIRALNRENKQDEGLGVIDYNTITYSWEYTRWRVKPSEDIQQWQQQKLVGFCRRKQYPMGWSKIPPVHNHAYEPYEPAYWEKKWDVFDPWLKLLWLMRKTLFEEETIEEMKAAMLTQKTIFNDKLRENNKIFEANPFTHTLDFTSLLDILDSMALCLTTTHKNEPADIKDFELKQYETKREILRQICELNGYPQTWIPADFETEFDTIE